MSLEELAAANKRTVGTKQTLKALERGVVKVVYLAKDAERHVIDPVLKICETKNIPIVWIDNMKLLGETCSIEAGCATASITEE